MKITGNLKRHYLIAFWVSLVCSIGLLVGGFFTPPQGEISGTVLEGAGLIFLYPALSFAAKALEEKNKIMIQHGQTTIQIGQDELEDTEEGIEDAETETL